MILTTIRRENNKKIAGVENFFSEEKQPFILLVQWLIVPPNKKAADKLCQQLQ
jgi:hypothetical protein